MLYPCSPLCQSRHAIVHVVRDGSSVRTLKLMEAVKCHT